MPNRTRTPSDKWPSERAYVPHPTWSGEVSLAELARPLPAAEFWHRLGL